MDSQRQSFSWRLLGLLIALSTIGMLLAVSMPRPSAWVDSPSENDEDKIAVDGLQQPQSHPNVPPDEVRAAVDSDQPQPRVDASRSEASEIPQIGEAVRPAIDTSLSDLIARVDPAVVRIDVEGINGNWLGSGFVVREEGIVVTNHHVMNGAQRARVTFANGRSAVVSGVLFCDPKRDIAIVKIVRSGKLSTLALASDIPKKGETVVAFGAPQGLSFSATDGIVSAIRQAEEMADLSRGGKTGTWIQTSAPISGGNSGGPLVNLRGEVVGANTMSHRVGQNLNLAVSSKDIQEALDAAVSAELVRLPLKPDPSESEGGDVPKNPNDPVLAARMQFFHDIMSVLDARKTQIRGIEQTIEEHKKALKTAMLSGDEGTTRTERATIRAARDQIVALIEERWTVISLPIPNLQTGQIGHLGKWLINVLQVIDKNDGSFLAAPVNQRTGRREKEILVRRCDISDVVDGQVHRIPENLVFQVLGTHTYPTASGGSNTVFELACILDMRSKETGLEAHRPSGDGLPEFTEAERKQLEILQRQAKEQKLQESRAREAKGKLALARQFLVRERTDTAKRRLEEIVEEFPETEAAKEAAELLKEL